MEFPSGVPGSEAPVDDGPGLVALAFQGLGLPAERSLVGEPLLQAGAGQYAELDFRHIQPSAVLGRMVKLQPFGNSPGLGSRERFVQRRLAMGIQIVQNHSNHRDLRVGLIHQPAHLVGEVLLEG